MIPLRLTVLGGGVMGEALIKGLLDAKICRPMDVTVTDVHAPRRSALQKTLGVKTSDNNRKASLNAQGVLLCVKPQQMAVVLSDIAGAVKKNQWVLSVAAGVSTQQIESALGPLPVIRVMPNTPALLRAGTLVYTLGRWATLRHDKIAKNILNSLGLVWKTTEDKMDAVTALSGSGPAYVFYLAECLSQAGHSLGLPAPLAEALARQTIYGAGRMLAETSDPASILRQKVTSPGGTTEAALKVFIRKNMLGLFKKALEAARDRSAQLSAGVNR